jgi:LacI family transcriptional regulator
MTTLKKVAEHTGLSIKTISRVVNNDPNVNAQTRQIVMDAIREVGYRPNAAARHIRNRRSHTLGLITDEVATNPFAVNIIKGAQECASEHNMMLLIAVTSGDVERTAAVVETMLERQVEGVMYASWYHRAVTLPDNIYEAPTVLVDCFVEDHRLPSVVPDEFDGGFRATEILIQKGHQRIGLINLPLEVPAGRGRLAGYRQALQHYHIPFDADLVRTNATGQADAGYAEACALIDVANPPSAIFCGNDRTAMGAYDALKERGIRIPQDMALIGFDNQDFIAAYLRPPLSTMALPHYEMGRWAVEHLLNPPQSAAPIEAMLHCPYIQRASV